MNQSKEGRYLTNPNEKLVIKFVCLKKRDFMVFGKQLEEGDLCIPRYPQWLDSLICKIHVHFTGEKPRRIGQELKVVRFNAGKFVRLSGFKIDKIATDGQIQYFTTICGRKGVNIVCEVE